MKHPGRMTRAELISYVFDLKRMIGSLQKEILRLTKNRPTSDQRVGETNDHES